VQGSLPTDLSLASGLQSIILSGNKWVKGIWALPHPALAHSTHPHLAAVCVFCVLLSGVLWDFTLPLHSSLPFFCLHRLSGPLPAAWSGLTALQVSSLSRYREGRAS
jgi:hypothetical protein